MLAAGTGPPDWKWGSSKSAYGFPGAAALHQYQGQHHEQGCVRRLQQHRCCTELQYYHQSRPTKGILLHCAAAAQPLTTLKARALVRSSHTLNMSAVFGCRWRQVSV